MKKIVLAIVLVITSTSLGGCFVGKGKAPVTVKGFVTTTTDTGTHTVINSAFAAGSQVSLEVQVGNNATPTTGNPKFTGEFFVESYKPALATGAAVTFEAVLKPATGSAPSWGTIS